MSAINPNPEAIKALTEAADEGPIVMVNLLKFKPDGGAEAYARYAQPVTRMIEEMGGKIVYSAPVERTVVGDKTWDAVALVQYPSRKAFLSMVTSPEYQKFHVHREEGLEATELYATNPGGLASMFGGGKG